MANYRSFQTVMTPFDILSELEIVHGMPLADGVFVINLKYLAIC